MVSRAKVTVLMAAIWVFAAAFPFESLGQNPTLAQLPALAPEPFFESNQGQIDSNALFVAQGTGYSARLERDGVALIFARSSPSSKDVPNGAVVRLTFVGASREIQLEGLEKQPGISNYFFGSDPAKWRTRIAHFSRVAYRQLYPGVDLIFYFRDGQLEYDIEVQPGADPSTVKVRVEGATAALNAIGDVVISAAHNEIFKIRKAITYQKEESKHVVSANYVLRENTVTLALADYDHASTLVIDPALAFSTFLGGNCPIDSLNQVGCTSEILDMAVDDTGIYLVGGTNASVFPNQSGQPMATNIGNDQTFILKLDPTGSKVLFSTLLGCSDGFNIAVDSKGAVYISGRAAFNRCNVTFPLTAGTFNSKPPTFGDFAPYAAKLSSDGAMLLYSTLLMLDSGTVSNQQFITGSRIAVDSNGAAYIGGSVQLSDFRSSLQGLPTTIGAFQTSSPGNPSLFVMKLNPAGSALEYSTYVGAVGVNTSSSGFAIDSSGSAYVAGSAGAGYPTTKGAYQEQNTTGLLNAVLTKLSTDGSSLVYSTYFGSPGSVEAAAIAISSTGEAVLIGRGEGLPTTPGAVCTNSPTNDLTAYVARFNSAGSALVYSTTLCGGPNLSDDAEAVAVDSSGAAYVAAYVEPISGSPFPFLQPIQIYVFGSPPSTNGVVKLDSSGALQWSTFLGFQVLEFQMPQSIAVDSSGAVYLLNSQFTTADAFQPVPKNPGTYLAKIVPSLGAPVPALHPRSMSFFPQVVGSSSSPNDVVIGNFGDATLATPTVSITGDFSQTNGCTSPIAGGSMCEASVVFTPTAGGTRTGTLTVHFGGALPDQTVALTGTATVATATPSPSPVVFPPQTLNTTSTAKQITIANNGTGPLTISSVKVGGDFAQTNACGSPVQPGGNCTVQVTFTPTAQGTRQSSLMLTDNALDSPQTIPLSGFGGQASMVSLSTAALNFSVQQNVGSTSPALPVIVTNIGNIGLNVSHITTAGDFSQTNNCGTVAAGGNCTIQVSFAPTAAGPRNGTLTITDDSITSPESVTLAGVGADFSFPPPPGPTTATISAGQMATYTLTVNSMGGSSETVNFSCSGLPALSTCAITPPSTTVNGIPQNFTVTITTTAASTAFNAPKTPDWPFGLWAVVLSSSILILRRYRQLRWSVVASLGVLMLWMGCGGGGGAGGGGGHPGTPSGNYTVVVTATATSGGGSLSHSTNLTLVVR